MSKIETILHSDWNLCLKSGSTGILVCDRASNDVLDSAKWPSLHEMNVLGHWVSCTNAIRSDWQRTRKHMWASFWNNAGHNRARQLPPLARVSLILKTVQPCFVFKCSRWPFQRSIADELDKTQRTMVEMCVPCHILPDEDINTYIRRRHKQASKICSAAGNWSTVWAGRVISWQSHVARGINYGHPVVGLLRHQDAAWLEAQRLRTRPTARYSLRSGELGRRVCPGRPQPRWDECIQLANSIKTSCSNASHDNSNASKPSVFTRINRALSFFKASTPSLSCLSGVGHSETSQ